MMNETPLTKFVALITFDSETEKINSRISSLEKEIVSVQKKEEELAELLNAAQQAVRTAKKDIDEHEFALKEIDQQIQNKKSKMEAAASPREHRAIMAEIESLGVRQSREEENLLSSWSAHEQRKKVYDEAVQNNEKQVQELQAAVVQKQQQIITEKAQFAERGTQRVAYEQGIPEEWLTKYAAMRSRVTNPVVPIENESCSACFHSMSDQELVQLRRKALIQCKGCYRFLYSPEVYRLI